MLVVVTLLFCNLFLASTSSEAQASACPYGGEHDFVATILQYATEDSSGLRVVRCTNCGYETTQVIPATGHAWGPWVIEQAASCTSEGLRYHTCSKDPGNPHTEYEIIPMLSSNGEHDFLLTKETPPTCTDAGLASHTCRYCGQTREETLVALGHNWGEWKVTTTPTKEREGQQTRTCQNDNNHTETVTVPVLTGETLGGDREHLDVTAPGATATGAETSQQNTFWSFEPTAVDAVAVSLGGVILIAFSILVLPGIFQLLWVRKKKKEAYDKALTELEKEQTT